MGGVYDTMQIMGKLGPRSHLMPTATHFRFQVFFFSTSPVHIQRVLGNHIKDWPSMAQPYLHSFRSLVTFI